MVSESDEMARVPVLGALTYREWHAFVEGVYCGYVQKQNQEYTDEDHYWRIGYLVGAALRKNYGN